MDLTEMSKANGVLLKASEMLGLMVLVKNAPVSRQGLMLQHLLCVSTKRLARAFGHLVPNCCLLSNAKFTRAFLPGCKPTVFFKARVCSLQESCFQMELHPPGMYVERVRLCEMLYVP